MTDIRIVCQRIKFVAVIFIELNDTIQSLDRSIFGTRIMEKKIDMIQFICTAHFYDLFFWNVISFGISRTNVPVKILIALLRDHIHQLAHDSYGIVSADTVRRSAWETYNRRFFSPVISSTISLTAFKSAK